jgi:hypothetical protein
MRIRELISENQTSVDQLEKDLIRCYDVDPFSQENLTLYNVPEDFRNKTLIIKYSDIYNKDGSEYTAIGKIENFLQKKIGTFTRQSYEMYVANRVKLPKS